MSPVMNVHTVHTSSLGDVAKRELRAFLEEASDDRFDDDDWDHTLGGIHALVREAGGSWPTEPSSSDASSTAVGRCVPGTWRASPFARTAGAAATAGK